MGICGRAKCGFITRQCIAVGICGILVLSGISAAALFYTYWRVSANLCVWVMESVRSKAAKLNADLQGAGYFVQDLAVTLEYCQYTSADVAELLRQHLAVQKEQNPAVHSAAIAFLPAAVPTLPSGMFVAGWDESTRTIQAREDPRWRDQKAEWFLATRNAGALVWNAPHFDAAGKNVLMTSCRAPFYRRDLQGAKHFAGVVCLDLDLGKLQEFIQGGRAVPERYYCALLSRHGTVIAHPNPRFSGRLSLLELAEKYPPLKDVREAISQAREGMLYVRRTSILDEPVQYFFAVIPETDWTLVAAFPTRLIYERLYQLLWILLGCTLAGTFILVLATSWVLRRSGAPLKQLAAAAENIGKGDFSTPLPEYFAKDEIGHLNASLRNMQQELLLRLDELARSIARQEKMEGELQAGLKIQQSLLPVFKPPLPECREFSLAARLIPARIVSGDLYDLFMIDDHRIGVIIGDVSGKGIPAALLMAVTQTFLHCAMCKCKTTGEIVTNLGLLLGKNNPNVMYVTYFIGIIDLRTGEMQYTNAGHNPLWLQRADGSLTELNTVHGLPVGMMEHEEYGYDQVLLGVGDRLLAYTDGVTEAKNDRGEEFGVARLCAALAMHPPEEPPEALVESLFRELTRFIAGQEFGDDATIWCFRFNAMEDQTAELPHEDGCLCF